MEKVHLDCTAGVRVLAFELCKVSFLENFKKTTMGQKMKSCSRSVQAQEGILLCVISRVGTTKSCIDHREPPLLSYLQITTIIVSKYYEIP